MYRHTTTVRYTGIPRLKLPDAAPQMYHGRRKNKATIIKQCVMAIMLRKPVFFVCHQSCCYRAWHLKIRWSQLSTLQKASCSFEMIWWIKAFWSRPGAYIKTYNMTACNTKEAASVNFARIHCSNCFSLLRVLKSIVRFRSISIMQFNSLLVQNWTKCGKDIAIVKIRRESPKMYNLKKMPSNCVLLWLQF